MKIKAFTLTELLIALAVVGILIAILLPVISNLIPDQNALMAKRAYYGVQQITSDLINDGACYPDKTQAMEYTSEDGTVVDESRTGFDDGYGYSDCMLWGGNKNEDTINSEDANSKFLILFMNKLDLAKNSGTENWDDVKNQTSYSFTTKDKMTWTAENMSLGHSNTDPKIEFVVDVNGNDGPNCKSATDTDGTDCDKKKDFDRFTVTIHADGKLDIAEEWAADAVGVDADITGGEE